MDWVLIFSLQWIVAGVPTPPTTWTNVDYDSKKLCEAAAEAIRAEMAKPIPDAVTLVRVVCVQRK